MFKTKNEKRLAVCGSTALLSLVAVMTVQSITASISSTVPEGLVGLSIVPANPTVTAGESIRLSAEGDYGTNTMPIRADWLLPKEGMGTLGECSNTKTCTFTAGDTPGTTSVQAQVGDGEFTDMVDIRIEQKKDVLVNPFTDELPEWALEPVVRMYKKLIVKGYDDGRYGPGDSVTNGQVITLLERILKHAKLVEKPSNCVQVYEDVPKEHYAFKPACLFSRQGWSTADDMFLPDSPASRGEMAGFINQVIGSTILSAKGSDPQQGQMFDDVAPDHPRFADIAVSNQTGIMTGYPNGDFGVDDDLNRAAAAVVMFRVLDNVETLGIKTLKGYSPDAHDERASSYGEVSSDASSEEASSEESSVVSSEEEPSEESSAVSSEGSSEASSSVSSVDSRVFSTSTKPAAPSSRPVQELTSTAHGGEYSLRIRGIGGGNYDVRTHSFVRDYRSKAYDLNLSIIEPDINVLPPRGAPGYRKTKIAPLPKSSYAAVTEENCRARLSGSNEGVHYVELTDLTGAVCFRTDEGNVGKIGNAKAHSFDPYDVEISLQAWGKAKAEAPKPSAPQSVKTAEGEIQLPAPNTETYYDFSERREKSVAEGSDIGIRMFQSGWNKNIYISGIGKKEEDRTLFSAPMAKAYYGVTAKACAETQKKNSVAILSAPLKTYCFTTSDGYLGKMSMDQSRKKLLFELWKDESHASSLPANRDGACYIFNEGYHPRADEPDIGKNYAKKHIPGDFSITQLRSACTQGIMDGLIKEYCAQENTPGYVETSVALYNEDSSIKQRTCWPFRCELFKCSDS